MADILNPLPTNLWPGYEKFQVVQRILDRNKLLINEINHNHDGRSPIGLQRNVVLIRELNNNIAKVRNPLRKSNCKPTAVQEHFFRF